MMCDVGSRIRCKEGKGESLWQLELHFLCHQATERETWFYSEFVSDSDSPSVVVLRSDRMSSLSSARSCMSYLICFTSFARLTRICRCSSSISVLATWMQACSSSMMHNPSHRGFWWEENLHGLIFYFVHLLTILLLLLLSSDRIGKVVCLSRRWDSCVSVASLWPVQEVMEDRYNVVRGMQLFFILPSGSDWKGNQGYHCYTKHHGKDCPNRKGTLNRLMRERTESVRHRCCCFFFPPVE